MLFEIENDIGISVVDLYHALLAVISDSYTDGEGITGITILIGHAEHIRALKVLPAAVSIFQDNILCERHGINVGIKDEDDLFFAVVIHINIEYGLDIRVNGNFLTIDLFPVKLQIKGSGTFFVISFKIDLIFGTVFVDICLENNIHRDNIACRCRCICLRGIFIRQLITFGHSGGLIGKFISFDNSGCL